MKKGFTFLLKKFFNVLYYSFKLAVKYSISPDKYPSIYEKQY